MRTCSIDEIKIWLRWRLLSYQFAELTYAQHMAVIGQVEKRMQPFIDSPDEATRLVARSVAQYRAQLALRPPRSRLLTELIACALLLPGLVRWLLRGLMVKPVPEARVKGVRWNQSLFRYRRNPDMFHTPGELQADRPETVFVPDRYLRPDDIRFLWQATRTAWPLLPALRIQWIFKMAKELAFARPLIDRHPADYALFDSECNCALSLLTLFAHRHGMKLYNVQHGDQFMSAVTTFFEADRYYGWDEYYTKLFGEMRGRADFRVYQNPSFTCTEEEKQMAGEGIGIFLPSIELTLPTQTEKEAFARAINAMAEHAPVRVRPHPAFAHERALLEPLLSGKVEITSSGAEPAKHFILRHRVIITAVSTTVLEAVMLGREAVCFRSKYQNEVANYHFCFKKPNCHICDLNQMADVALGLLEKKRAYSAAGA